jgi:hypothetical protein
MRFALIGALFAAGSLVAEDPKLPANTNQPSLVLASAAEADGKITLRLRLVEVTAAAEKKTVTSYQTVTQVEDGKIVTKQVPIQQEVMMMVMKPSRWREVKLTADEANFEVRDLAGKVVPAKKLPSLLEKESPVLLSTSGPIDSFYLQLAKEGTLVVIAPQDKVMVGQAGLPVPIGPVGPGVAPGVQPLVPPPPPPPPPPLPVPPKEGLKDPPKEPAKP